MTVMARILFNFIVLYLAIMLLCLFCWLIPTLRNYEVQEQPRSDPIVGYEHRHQETPTIRIHHPRRNQNSCIIMNENTQLESAPTSTTIV